MVNAVTVFWAGILEPVARDLVAFLVEVIFTILFVDVHSTVKVTKTSIKG